MQNAHYTLGLALWAFLSSSSHAQETTWIVQGQVANCTPGQSIQVTNWTGSWSLFSSPIPVDANCTFYATWISSGPIADGFFTTTVCGQTVNMIFQQAFNLTNDTVISTFNFPCGAALDCQGFINGPYLPGTPCDDGDPLTTGDTWDPNCQCVGNSVQNILNVTGTVTGCNGPTPVHIMDYWTVPPIDTTIYTDPNCNYFFSYSPSNSIQGWVMVEASCNGGLTWMWDSTGYSFTGVETVVLNFNCAGQIDCLGIPGGSALPGTACVDSVGGILLNGIWDANCVCQTNALLDCTGIPGGPNMPGTPCNDGDSLTVQDTWSPACVCAGVALPIDCNGVLNGPDMPGTPCDDGDPLTSNDMWDVNCDCVGTNNAPCNADFWVLQGFTVDSLNVPQPIPFELWIWNLSTGGTGTYTFLWSFGDGTTSTDPFPTHTYGQSGPYEVCLTIDDGAGCVDTHCDSVSVDQNGLYTGFTGGGGERQQGFTINVQNQIADGVNETVVSEGIATWPNPTSDDLNIALTDMSSGKAEVTIMDAAGRLVMAEQHILSSGRNQLLLNTSGLTTGLYLLRITNGTQVLSQRIVKGN